MATFERYRLALLSSKLFQSGSNGVEEIFFFIFRNLGESGAIVGLLTKEISGV